MPFALGPLETIVNVGWPSGLTIILHTIMSGSRFSPPTVQSNFAANILKMLGRINDYSWGAADVRFLSVDFVVSGFSDLILDGSGVRAAIPSMAGPLPIVVTASMPPSEQSFGGSAILYIVYNPAVSLESILSGFNSYSVFVYGGSFDESAASALLANLLGGGTEAAMGTMELSDAGTFHLHWELQLSTFERSPGAPAFDFNQAFSLTAIPNYKAANLNQIDFQSVTDAEFPGGHDVTFTIDPVTKLITIS